MRRPRLRGGVDHRVRQDGAVGVGRAVGLVVHVVELADGADRRPGASSRNATRLIAWIDSGVSADARSYIAPRHVQKSSAAPAGRGDQLARCARPRIARWKACECAVASAGRRRVPSGARVEHRDSLPHVARAGARHVVAGGPVPVPRGADRPARRRRAIRPGRSLPTMRSERPLPDRLRADVVAP